MENKKISYALGMNIGVNLVEDFNDMNLEEFLDGLKVIYDNEQPKLSVEEYQSLITKFRDMSLENRKNKIQEVIKKNKEEEKKYLEDNKKNNNVVTTESGLQYEVIKKGNGKKPTIESTVEVSYVGKLLNGSVFDKSDSSQGSVKFPITNLIQGWQEALLLMSVGDKFKLTVPSNLAYGDRGVDNLIQPGSALLFDIELIGIA